MFILTASRAGVCQQENVKQQSRREKAGSRALHRLSQAASLTSAIESISKKETWGNIISGRGSKGGSEQGCVQLRVRAEITIYKFLSS